MSDAVETASFLPSSEFHAKEWYVLGVWYHLQALQAAVTKWRLGGRCTTDSDFSKNAGHSLDIFSNPIEGCRDNT